MDVRKKIALALTGAALVAALAPAASASKPKLVWEDPAGDAFLGGAEAGPIFEQGGFDIVSGEIARNEDNLEFTVTHSTMQPFGSTPEAFRFLWNFRVDDTPYRFTAKSVDIGKPDVVAGQTTERVGRVDLEGHFRLEGECVTDSSLPVGTVNCPPVAYLDGVWDPAAKSFTIVLPLETVEAKTKSVIIGGDANICQICWVTHYAERSLNSTIIDQAGMLSKYKVPKK